MNEITTPEPSANTPLPPTEELVALNVEVWKAAQDVKAADAELDAAQEAARAAEARVCEAKRRHVLALRALNRALGDA